MSDIIKDAKRLAELKVPPLRAEITVHEDEDPRYTDDCLVQIVEKDDEYSIWYEEEHGGYEHGELHFAHVFAAAPELAQALAEETYEYAVAFKSTNGLGYLDRSGKPQPWPLLAAWYLTKEISQVALMNSEYRKETLCIVRRRVSPVEVINE